MQRTQLSDMLFSREPSPEYDGNGRRLPGLFGLTRSNRDFLNPEDWGKNKFNSAFPAALACYMHSINLHPVYLRLRNRSVIHDVISAEELFGLNPVSSDLYFAFENYYAPYFEYCNDLARIDLVTIHNETRSPLRPIEIKLTALPDNQTSELSDESYGSELVVRPDTIVYLALSIIHSIGSNFERKSRVQQILQNICNPIEDWGNENNVASKFRDMTSAIEDILALEFVVEIPLVMQPVWKTIGKSTILHENCLDIFVWSNKAFTRLFMENPSSQTPIISITRPQRSLIWLVKMIWEFIMVGRVDFESITRTLLYGTRNDKAFAVGGKITNALMRCDELTQPRITKQQIREIILGGGQNFLSPERRFDAILVNSPGIF